MKKHKVIFGETGTAVELAIFSVGDLVCGLRSIEVQEIIKFQEITVVHHAPDYVKGVINLRGQIVTIIDMRSKFNMDLIDAASSMRIVIVKYGEESMGLLVDAVSDIINAPVEEIDPPPSNLSGLTGAYFLGIFKKEDSLVAILNIGEILKIER